MFRSLNSRIAVILLLPLLAACSEADSTPAKDKLPVPVLAERISFDSSTVEQSLSATIEPRVVSDQAFRVQGKVTARLVNVGNRVREGQPLATLDDTDLKLQLTQAKAEAEAAANVLQQQGAEEQRLAKLLKGGWVAASAYDRQKAALDEARGRLARAEQAVELARNAVAYAVLTADRDGVVIRTSTEPGQVMGAGQTAVTVAQEGEIEALVAVPETRLKEITEGTARVEIWSNPSQSYAARLRELSPVADPATRTYAARFTIDNPDKALMLGMSAELKISLNGGRGTSIPLAALLDQGAGPAVWSVDPQSGSLTMKWVEVASYGAATARVTGGVSDGDYVVVMGAQKLDSGLKVRVVDSLER